MEWLFFVTFVVTVLVSILSGMSGGGGGFVVMPYFLFLGLPPANALATSKFGGLGTALGTLVAFKGKGLVHKKLVVPLMIITFFCSILAAWLIPQIDPAAFENAIGFVLFAMVPTLFIKKASFQPGSRSRKWIIVGFIAFTIFSFMQGLVGTGLGTLVLLALMYLFGLSALEANATKRMSQSVQAVVLVILLGLGGMLVWGHAIAGFLGSIVGSHIGAHIAIKKGNEFVKIVLATTMVVSGVVLIIW